MFRLQMEVEDSLYINLSFVSFLNHVVLNTTIQTSMK